jgi:hypothetical protein
MALVQFLTNQMGRNVASGIGGQMKALMDTVAMLKGQILAAASATKEAA